MTDFKQIFNQYNKKVFNLFLFYTSDYEDARDLTQEVFIRIHEKINDFRKDANVSTWIYRIAVNQALDHLRKKKRKQIFLSFFQIFMRENEKEKNAHLHPGSQIENKEILAQLLHAMHKLPENQRTAMLLSKWEGLSQKEIADVMKVSEKAVESLIQRAKLNIKKHLNDEYEI